MNRQVVFNVLLGFVIGVLLAPLLPIALALWVYNETDKRRTIKMTMNTSRGIIKTYSKIAIGLESVELDLPIDPKTMVTAQQKGERIVYGKGGRAFVHHYTKSKVRKSHQNLALIINAKKAEKQWEKVPQDRPVWVGIEYVYGLGSKPKKFQGAIKTTRPDDDNLGKGLLDVCTQCELWDDDSQVQKAYSFRRYAFEGENPHIVLQLMA